MFEYNAPGRKSNPARVRYCRASVSLLSLGMEPFPGFQILGRQETGKPPYAAEMTAFRGFPAPFAEMHAESIPPGRL